MSIDSVTGVKPNIAHQHESAPDLRKRRAGADSIQGACPIRVRAVPARIRDWRGTVPFLMRGRSTGPQTCAHREPQHVPSDLESHGSGDGSTAAFERAFM